LQTALQASPAFGNHAFPVVRAFEQYQFSAARSGTASFAKIVIPRDIHHVTENAASVADDAAKHCAALTSTRWKTGVEVGAVSLHEVAAKGEQSWDWLDVGKMPETGRLAVARLRIGWPCLVLAPSVALDHSRFMSLV